MKIAKILISLPFIVVMMVIFVLYFSTTSIGYICYILVRLHDHGYICVGSDHPQIPCSFDMLDSLYRKDIVQKEKICKLRYFEI